jgi:hypothetical protein
MLSKRLSFTQLVESVPQVLRQCVVLSRAEDNLSAHVLISVRKMLRDDQTNIN